MFQNKIALLYKMCLSKLWWYTGDTMEKDDLQDSSSEESSSTLTSEKTRKRHSIVPHRPKQTLIRQAFYLVDADYMKARPQQFYIRSLSGDIYLIKYERIFF